jgi:hypothetical protein
MIDLLPKPKKNEIRQEYRLRVFVVCLAALSFVLIVVVASSLPTYLFVNSRYQAFLAESQSDETQNRISQVKEIETVVQETNKKIDQIKSGTSVFRVKDLFREILESRNEGIVITRLSYDFGAVPGKKGGESTANISSVSVEGKSSDRANLLSFRDALTQKKEFTTVDLPISSLVKETDLSFSINIKLAPAASPKVP